MAGAVPVEEAEPAGGMVQSVGGGVYVAGVVGEGGVEVLGERCGVGVANGPEGKLVPRDGNLDLLSIPEFPRGPPELFRPQPASLSGPRPMPCWLRSVAT
jgi:hypothetical protein